MILRKQFLAHVAQTSPSPMLVEVARAEGSFFYTPEGKRYFDLVAGVSVSNVGHGNPAVVRAVQEQAARYMHVMVYGELVETPQVEYAARIASLLPAPLESVYFVNSGAEAVEGALKLAKRFTRRTEIVSMRRAYHGSTHGAMSMMGTPEGEEWKAAFRPLLPDVRAIEFNDFEALDRITRCTAAVLVEPVQGESGVTPATKEFLKALGGLCKKFGAMLLFDEIQCGVGRSGKFLACQRYGVKPDGVSLAKGIAGGFPMGAIWLGSKYCDLFTPGSHGSTFGGNPLACAAALATLEEFERRGLVENAREMGELLAKGLDKVAKKFPGKIAAARGLGLMRAVAFRPEYPNAAVCEKLRENGLILIPGGATALSSLPPLTVKPSEIEKALKIFEKTISEL